MGRHKASEWWRWRKSKPEDPLLDNSHAVSNLERNLLIEDALRHLPEDQRMLLWLREVEGQSYAELASILELPIGTVRSRLFGARLALRDIWLAVNKGGDLYEVR